MSNRKNTLLKRREKMENIQEKLKEEALRRMKALKLHDEGIHTCVGDFRKTGNAWKSEFYGILYWLDDEEKKAVKNFEKEYSKHNIKVYHCYKAHAEFGEILYMFYVSSDKEDSAKNFDNNLKDGIIECYAHNFSEPAFSEFGTCFIKSQFGGVVIH